MNIDITAQDYKFIGLSRRKELSRQQLINHLKKISIANNKLYHDRIAKVYKIKFQQVGNADIYIWSLEAHQGYLNTQAKHQREQNRNIQ